MEYHSDSGNEIDNLEGELSNEEEKSHIGAELRCLSCNRRRSQRKRERVIGIANLALFLLSLTFIHVAVHRWGPYTGERGEITCQQNGILWKED